MHSLDHQVLHTLQSWVEQHHAAWLCTIVATHGSSPRPVGSLMACNNHGQVVGSLSGGCVEEELLEQLLGGEYTTLPCTVRYGLNADDNARLGLPCGGHLTVLIEKIDKTSLPDLITINNRLNERKCIKRTVALNSGRMWLEPVAQFEALTMDEHHCAQGYGPRYTLLLVGAGQLAASLAQMATMMDYRVLVTDPRAQKLEDFQAHLLGPDTEVLCIHGMPDDVVREQGNDPFSIVITLTHDPRIDDMALMEALTQNNFYVGALGSRKTTNQRLQRLQQLDLSPQQLARLHAPVGLAIGSKTAPEIAVAILAELTEIRRTALRHPPQAQGTR